LSLACGKRPSRRLGAPRDHELKRSLWMDSDEELRLCEPSKAKNVGRDGVGAVGYSPVVTVWRDPDVWKTVATELRTHRRSGLGRLLTEDTVRFAAARALVVPARMLLGSALSGRHLCSPVRESIWSPEACRRQR
jgi:hypothetical protein